MQIRFPDTPNHEDKYSKMFLIVKQPDIDTKSAFVDHMVQRL